MELIPTKWKDKIPKNHSYPFSSKTISQEFIDVPRYLTLKSRYKYRDEFWASNYHMPFPNRIREKALVKSHRRCCVCHEFAGRAITVHHITPEADGGENTLENAIALCLRCHSEVGHFNPRHSIGTKYSPSELVRHRNAWWEHCEKHPHEPVGKHLEITHKNKLITQDRHKYRLIIRYTNQSDKAHKDWKLQLYFPSSIPIEAVDFDHYESQKLDSQYFTLLETSSGDPIYPGEEVTIIENDEMFYVEYEMNHDLYYAERSENWKFIWRFFTSNSQPVSGEIP